MGIEKILNFPLNIGRITLSYVTTDPVGDTLFLAGCKCINDGLIVLGASFISLSAWHIPRIFKIRNRLSNAIKENKGLLDNRIIDTFNKASWCSHRATIAHLKGLGQGKYKEFKELLNKYSTEHYAKILGYQIKEGVKNGIIYFSSSFKDPSLY